MIRSAESSDSDNGSKTEKKRRSDGPKYVDLLLRVCHVVTSSVLFGGIVWAAPFVRLVTWHYLTIATGAALIIFSICRSRHWPYQGRGVVAWLHAGLIGLAHVLPEAMMPVLVTVLALGVIGSHLPGSIRHWSLLHGRRID